MLAEKEVEEEEEDSGHPPSFLHPSWKSTRPACLPFGIEWAHCRAAECERVVLAEYER